MRMKALPLFAAFSIIALITSCRDDRQRASGHVAATASASATPPGSATVKRPPPPPPSAEELAIIAPLERGAEIAGFVVRDVRGVENGVMRLVCAKDEAVVRLDIALTADEGPAPPATAGPYAIYYSLKGATPEDGDRLARKLAAVIAAHADAARPKGMTPFVPKEKPATTL